MTFEKGMSVIMAVALGMALSCARGADKEPNVSGDEVSGDDEAAQSAASSKSSGSSDDACMDRACSVHDECCNGYVCTFDPSVSRVQRYCLPDS